MGERKELTKSSTIRISDLQMSLLRQNGRLKIREGGAKYVGEVIKVYSDDAREQVQIEEIRTEHAGQILMVRLLDEAA